jgi:hypothetical protein
LLAAFRSGSNLTADFASLWMSGHQERQYLISYDAII